MGMAKILIVEDEQIIALELQARLKRLGYDVPVVVSSGEEALQQAFTTRPDLILMDIALSGKIDGIETARQLREQLDIPSIYLTARVDEATLARVKPTKPLGYILKPYVEKTLHQTIQMALESKQREQECRHWGQLSDHGKNLNR